MSGDKVKTLAGPALCIVGLVSLLFIALSFMTIASPGFLLYGFFSGEWLIEELAGTPLASTTGDNKIYYGLYRKCHHKQCSSYGKLYEPVREKTINLGSDQARHKPGCTVTEDG